MLQTDDLFLGAFGLVRGGELRGVEVRGTNGRRVAVFTIVGPTVDDVAREYHRGEALVDLLTLQDPAYAAPAADTALTTPKIPDRITGQPSTVPA